MYPSFLGFLSLRLSFRLLALIAVLTFAAPGLLKAQSATVSVAIGSGSHPYAVAVNPVTNQIYIADYGNATVTTINGQNNTVTTIPVGTNPVTTMAMVNPSAVAVDPATNRIYVANQGTAAKAYKDGGISVIDGNSNVVTSTINVPNGPVAVAVNGITSKVYVAEYANQGSDWYLGEIDEQTNSLTQIVNRYINGATNLLGVRPVAVAVNTIANEVYFADNGSNSLTILDGSTNTVKGMVYVSPSVTPVAVAVNPVIDHVYVATSYGSATVNPSVSVIDPAQTGTGGKGKVLKTVSVGSNPVGLAVNLVTNEVYVANSGDTFVTVIQDGATIGNGQTISVGNHPYGIAVNPTTNQVIVSNQSSNSVTVVDGQSNVATATVTVGSAPGAVAINPVTNKIYVANGGDSVSVLDGAINATKVAFVGAQPSAVAINPVTNKIYVANHAGNSVTVIDEVTSATATIGAGVGPVAVAVNPVTNKIYVANNLSYSVTVIDGASNTPTAVKVGPLPVALAVDPVTNLVYVANQGTFAKNFSDSSVTIVDGATNGTKTVPFGADVNNGIAGPLQLAAIAVDPYLNQIYVINKGTATQQYFDGAVYRLSGVDNTIVQWFAACATCQVPSEEPIAVAIGPSDANGLTKVYVANYASNDVDVFGPDGTYLSTVSTGSNPYAIAANVATGYVYVANSGSNTVTAINGNLDSISSTYLFATTTVNTGSVPYALAVNPTTNKVYVSAKSGNNVTVIDGPSNSSTTIATGLRPLAVAINPITGKAYIPNSGSDNVTIITEAAASGLANPLSVQVQGVSDQFTDAETSLFATSNANPSFTAVAQSVFGFNNPAPTSLYYQLDGTQGPWSTAAVSSGVGNNPADYSFALASVLPGVHTLYTYAVYGREGTTSSAVSGTGSTPQSSNIAAYPFAVINFPTTVTVTADANPQNAGYPVTFTACANPLGAAATYGGYMTFFDGAKRLGQKIIDPNDPNGPNPCPSLVAYGLSTGTHNITAVFSGSSNLSSSYGTLSEQVNLNLTLVIAQPAPLFNPNAGAVQICTTVNTFSCPVYGQAVKIAARVPLAGTVTFTVNGQPQTPLNVVGGMATLSLQQLPAGTYTVGAAFSGSGGQNLVATPLVFPVVQKPVTITPINVFRNYGVANPILHGIVVGFIPADGITASFSAPDATPTSNAAACYNIAVQFSDPGGKVGNYAVTLNPGCLSVNPLPLTLIALGETRPYGATDNFKSIVVGLLAADKAGFSVTFSTTVDQGAPVGTYKNVIVPTLVDNNVPPKMQNYFVSNTIKGSITVTKALLTATADSQTRAYGASDPPFTVALTGALASDGLGGFGTCIDTPASPVTTYLITPHLNDPNSRLSNYIVISKTGILSITKAALTVTGDDQTRPVGQANPTLTGQIAGALAADNIAASYSTTATTASPAGTYAIVPALAPNTKLSNYTVTIVNGTLTVTP